MTETLAYGYSSQSTPRELSNEYQNDRVYVVFRNLCIFVLLMKLASALEGLNLGCACKICDTVFYTAYHLFYLQNALYIE